MSHTFKGNSFLIFHDGGQLQMVARLRELAEEAFKGR